MLRHLVFLLKVKILEKFSSNMLMLSINFFNFNFPELEPGNAKLIYVCIFGFERNNVEYSKFAAIYNLFCLLNLH